MGINLGDIIDDGEDPHGEGVNMVARIEALVTQLDPNLAVAYASHSTSLTHLGTLGFGGFNIDIAHALAQRAIDLDPQEPRGHNALGQCHFLAGKRPMAIDEYKEAIRLNPNNDVAMHYLAHA